MKLRKIEFWNLWIRVLPFVILRVSGHSMTPTLRDGQIILVSGWFYLLVNPKKGDIVVFIYRNKYLVKRVKARHRENFLLEGDNRQDSLQVGWVNRRLIWGKVLR